jgi:predicted nucleotidyltransferase
MALKNLLNSKRDEILKIAEKYGAQNVRLFGSIARGEADEKSDVDLLVEMKPGRSLFDMGGMLMELETLLGCKVDIVTERGLKKRIREKVLKEAVPL